jgi:DNA-binding SARP family transcriptional activator/TolB-like protein
VLTLTTLGGLALDADGRDVGVAAAQRRPMALLAILAAAGSAAVSRERLAGLLWPDADPERARRSVAQALYTLRRATGAEDLVVGTTELRLNRSLVACDLVAFREALAAGRLAEAVDAYRGAFLDGFHVPGAVDFERWAETERAAVARDLARALVTLARAAEAGGDHAAAVHARRRLVALDPLDSSATLALMDALGRAGDVAGALRAARIHETLLREQLELPAPAAIRERVAALQVPGEPPRPNVAAPPVVPPVVVEPVASPSPIEPVKRGRRRRWALVGVGIAAALVVGTELGRSVERRRAPVAAAVPAPVLRADVLAVLPFATDSVDASLRYLGEGAADALARMLADGGPHAVDPGTVFAAVERLGPGSARDAWDRARRVGRAVGAGEVLVGRVAGTASQITITASLVDVATGERRAVASVGGAVDSLAALLDRLAARVVAGRAVDAERARAFAGVSLPVLRAYLEGEAAVRDDRIEDGLRLFQRALDRDSTFAPAALGLVEAADRYNAAEQHDRGLALAWAARDRLGERDHAYLTALAGPRYPAPSTAAEQLAAWERAVTLTPDRASTWAELGARLLYDGDALGLRTARDRAAAALRRALDLDPSYAPALRDQVELAARARDTATLARVAAPERLRAFGGDLTGYLLWRVATLRGDSATLARLHDRMPSLGVPSLRAIAMAAQHTGEGAADGERALRLLAARAALGAEQLDVLLAEHSLALNQGRPVAALDVTERLQDAQPGSRAHLRLRVLDALYADGDTTAAVAAARSLERVADAPPARDPSARALQLADVCVLAQWRLARLTAAGARRDDATVARVRAAFATLRAAPMPRSVVPVEATPPACAALLETTLAVALRAADARDRVERLDALMLTGPAIGDARTYAGLAVSRLHARLGDPDRALAAIRRRAYLRGWPRYLATSLWEESQLALVVGDDAGAATALKALLALRDQPEPPVRRQADSARAALARLAASR